MAQLLLNLFETRISDFIPTTMTAQFDDMNVVANDAKDGSSITSDVEEQIDTPKEPVRTVRGFKVAVPRRRC